MPPRGGKARPSAKDSRVSSRILRFTVIFLGGLLAIALLLMARGPGGGVPTVEEVRAQLDGWQLTPKQCAYESIHWTEDVPKALEESKRSGRPLVMFYTAGPIGHG